LVRNFLNHPCEPVRRDVESHANTSYMTPLVRIDRCFDERGRFEVTRSGVHWTQTCRSR
jgi:hypothetical protein